MRRLSLLAATAAAPAALFSAPLVAEREVELSSEDLLAPYYAKLQREIELPVAPANASIAPETVITRLAFGSCNHQLRPQDYWAQIAATDPQLFLFISDNNYGDQMWGGDASLATLREAYRVQSETPELAEFRSNIPMMIT
ncbi:MAG: hypothetical protein AAGE86_12500 [Pseudomonadota bacterium]